MTSTITMMMHQHHELPADADLPLEDDAPPPADPFGWTWHRGRVSDEAIARMAPHCRIRRVRHSSLPRSLGVEIGTWVGRATSDCTRRSQRRLAGPLLWDGLVFARWVTIAQQATDGERIGLRVPNRLIVEDRTIGRPVSARPPMRGILDLTTEDDLGRFLIEVDGDPQHAVFERPHNLRWLACLYPQLVDLVE